MIPERTPKPANPHATPHADLLQAAAAALGHAHAPYSKLRVGAAVRAASGKVYTGCNVECAAFPLGGCAERHAIAAVVLAEGSSAWISAIAISALDEFGNEAAIPPCGGCRQLIFEFGPDAEVVFRGRDGRPTVHPIRELLPHAFEL